MSFKKQGLFQILFFSIFLSACAPENGVVSDSHKVISEKSKSDTELGTDSTPSSDNIIFELGDSVCESGDCPEWVGSVISKTPRTATSDTYGTCSGTLIADNLFLTNKHCLPEDLRTKGADCNGRFKVVLPATLGLPKVEVGCRQIKNFTQNDLSIGTIPDWAILELAHPVNRNTPSELNNNVSTTDTVTLYPSFYGYNEGDENMTGIIRPVNCKLKQSVGPQSDFPQIDFKSCDQYILAGNSGSGVFDSRGDILGLMSHVVLDETSRRHRDGFRDESRTGLGTSIRFVSE